MTTPTPATNLVPACVNCGYARQGLAAADACPECGSIRRLPPGSEPWAAAVRSGLTMLCWTVPLSLLVWALPGLASITHANGSSPLFSDLTWPHLVAAFFAWSGVRRLAQAASSERARKRTARAGIVLLAFACTHAAGLPDGVYTFFTYSNVYFHSMNEWVVIVGRVCFAVWVWISIAHVADIGRSLGTTIIADRTVFWITRVLVPFFVIFAFVPMIANTVAAAITTTTGQPSSITGDAFRSAGILRGVADASRDLITAPLAVGFVLVMHSLLEMRRQIDTLMATAR